MQPAYLRTDWSVLSCLLRLAQREGWGVEFREDHILVSNRRAEEGVIVLPAVLMRHARSSGWQANRMPDGYMLRHPAVRQSISLQLEV
ncbi:MAG: hypothetical protein QJR07_03675 [Acetobacteraceae bacterium]|nr:hypothetical protein [Acetobacteraceae bacterium]